MIPFSKVSTGEEEIEAAARVIRSGWLAAGAETEAFEQEFAAYIADRSNDGLALTLPYCIFTNSCSSALRLAYKWARQEAGIHTVRTPRNTFCATYAMAQEQGLRYVPYGDERDPIVFAENRVNMHYGGIKDTTPCLIEDSAHRIEEWDTLVGKIRTYSFYATKNMTTGSGGMFVTYDKDIYEFARLAWKDGLSSSTHERQTGKSWDYKVELLAGGMDGNDIAAAIGREQLKKLPEFTKLRNERRDLYNEQLGGTWMGNHLYPYFVKGMEQVSSLITFLKERDIASGYHYPGTGWLGVSLPIYPSLTLDEVGYVCDVVKEWEAKCKTDTTPQTSE